MMTGRVERFCYAVSRRHRIEAARLRSNHPRRIIFAPPLVGGSLAQQLGWLRPLTRFGFDIVSFNYSGHGTSSGKFSLRQALHETCGIARPIRRIADREDLPFVGLAICFGAIPLIYSALQVDRLFAKLVLINGIMEISAPRLLHSFREFYLRQKMLSSDRISVAGGLRRYADWLLPTTELSGQRFGMLSRQRTRLSTTVLDGSCFRPLAGASLPGLPALCLFTRNDRVRRSLAGYRHRNYVGTLRRILPGARFRELSGDHFLSQSHCRREACDGIADFLG